MAITASEFQVSRRMADVTSGRATTGEAPAGKSPSGKAGETVAAELAAIARTDPQGAGSAAAHNARDELAGRGIEIPQLLGQTSLNWRRS
jgi:hypothetical protein